MKSGRADVTRLPPHFDVLVSGTGLAAELAALDCARIGLRTALVSQVSTQEQRMTASARDGVMESLCRELGVDYEALTPAPGEAEILGIPANPFSRLIRESCGWTGSWRAYLDRLRPLLAIGEERNLARLVKSRLGSRVLNRVVRPRTRELFGCEPETVNLAECVPGLLQAMSRVGSLTLGVVELATADPRSVGLIRPTGGIRALEEEAQKRADYFAVSRMPTLPSGFKAGASIDLTPEFFATALDRAIPAAREYAATVRARLLGDVHYRAIGPVDLEQ